MQKQLFIYCDQDSLDRENLKILNTTKHSTSGRSPYYKTNKTFNFPSHPSYTQTPSTQFELKQSYEFKTPKYEGIIEKKLLQRLAFYDQRNKEIQQNMSVSAKIKQEDIFMSQLRQKPEINQISQQLFQKIRKQRRLSPNILQRFQTYECQRVSKQSKYELLKSYGMKIQNNTPKCRSILKQVAKQKSPIILQQRNFNRLKSKSQRKLNRQKSRSYQKPNSRIPYKNENTIGKIIKTKQLKELLNDTTIKNSPLQKETLRSRTYQTQQSGYIKSDQKYLGQKSIFKQNKTYQTAYKKNLCQEMINKKEKLSPFYKKNNNSNQWKVIS